MGQRVEEIWRAIEPEMFRMEGTLNTCSKFIDAYVIYWQASFFLCLLIHESATLMSLVEGRLLFSLVVVFER